MDEEDLGALPPADFDVVGAAPTLQSSSPFSSPPVAKVLGFEIDGVSSSEEERAFYQERLPEERRSKLVQRAKTGQRKTCLEEYSTLYL